jgi:DNA-binding transcriptional LysR family regulator
MASETGHAAHRMVQHALEAEIAPEHVLLRLSSFNAAAIVASRTDGVATVPANVATLFAEPLGLATFRPPMPLPPYEIAQYWHERFHRDPGHRWLRSELVYPHQQTSFRVMLERRSRRGQCSKHYQRTARAIRRMSEPVMLPFTARSTHKV